jgi:hypothetical protein
MERESDPLRVALRVLGGMMEGRSPDTSDVRYLQREADLPADTPPDELACEVVRRLAKRPIQAPRL